MKPSPHTQFGLFSVRNFLSPIECGRIRSEMSSAEGNPASIVKTDERLLDENVRRTVRKEVSEETRRLVSEKLMGLRDELGAYFGVELSHPQKPEFLYYREGDFFQCHTDKGMNPKNPQEVKDRLVSAVVFLNDEKDEPGPDTYTGGSFIIYGILNDPRFESQGFKVTGTAGTLIAFRSETFHEVTAVTSGMRYTAVSWFA
ncbi:MAG TPA: 2OG-Fe(II) oxygenase [Thermodesulfobacteriota bacterium]|nr:2OG-Fe(II) oxygenase [Thermodesulfobacteriota bacterium]